MLLESQNHFPIMSYIFSLVHPYLLTNARVLDIGAVVIPVRPIGAPVEEWPTASVLSCGHRCKWPTSCLPSTTGKGYSISRGIKSLPQDLKFKAKPLLIIVCNLVFGLCYQANTAKTALQKITRTFLNDKLLQYNLRRS